MNNQFLIGVPLDLPLDAIAAAAAPLLEVAFQERDSFYYGG